MRRCKCCPSLNASWVVSVFCIQWSTLSPVPPIPELPTHFQGVLASTQRCIFWISAWGASLGLDSDRVCTFPDRQGSEVHPQWTASIWPVGTIYPWSYVLLTPWVACLPMVITSLFSELEFLNLEVHPFIKG